MKHRWKIVLAIVLTFIFSISCGGGDEADSQNNAEPDDDVDEQVPDQQSHPTDNGPAADSGRYIIVAADNLLSSVSDLIDYRTGANYEVIVKSVSEIEDKFDGYETADAIREYLKTAYDPDADNYLLLVGSASSIPMPELMDIYSDYFYAEITGDFDSDGDGILGEWGEDSYDLEPEFRVGRIPLDEQERIEDVVSDTISFEAGEGGNFDKTMLGASYIMITGDSALLMEIISRNLLEPNGYDVVRIYEAGSPFPPDYELTRDVLKQVWPTEAPRFFMWGSHGSTTGAGGFIRNEDAQYYESQGTPPTVVMSSACYNSSPERYDNLGASLLGRCAVAFIGSTTIAHPGDLGEISLTYLLGLDHFLIRHSTISQSLDETKRAMIELFFNMDEYHRELCLLNFLGFNLYGDPALRYPTPFD